MVNERLIEDGYANAYTRFPFQYADQFREAERRAREAGRGLWIEGALEAPAQSEVRSNDRSRAPPDQATTVYVTRTGKKYHLGGCRYLSKSKIPMALSTASLSYGPCSVCRPPQR